MTSTVVSSAPQAFRTRGCSNPRTEHRASRLSQLQQLWTYVQHMLRETELIDDSPYSATSGRRIEAEIVNMYHLCEHFVMPLTKPFECSWVELVATGEQRPDWFVSHAWSTRFTETLQMLEWHAECRELGQEAQYWIW